MADNKTNRADSRVQTPVVVIYQDSKCRDHAVAFCDALASRFWPTHGINITWYSFDSVQEPTTVADSTAKAINAGLIVFSTHPGGEFPIDVILWIQKWSSKRGEREGALVGLMDPAAIQGVADDKHVYLRNVARHAGMDYLTRMPDTITRGIPDSLESYSQRAERITSVLDEILHKQLQFARPPVAR
jgi:hypothetical protein